MDPSSTSEDIGRTGREPSAKPSSMVSSIARGSSNQRGGQSTLHSPIPTLPLQSSSTIQTKLGTTPPTPPVTHPIKLDPEQHTTSERAMFPKARSGK